MSHATRVLSPDEIHRVVKINRKEQIEAEYVPRLSDSGMGIQLEIAKYDPPRLFPDWDTEGRRRRSAWWLRELSKGGILISTESDNEILGFAVSGSPHRDGSAELIAQFVDANHRRCGVGRSLLTAIEGESRNRGIRSLYAGVNHTVATVEFYRNSDYQIMALVDEAISNHALSETGIVMTKKL